MVLTKGIVENLRFLVAEVAGQLSDVRNYLSKGEQAAAQRVLDRSGYSHNLKQRIHQGCLQQLSCRRDRTPNTLWLRSMETVATELDRITGLCRDCIQQVAELEELLEGNRKIHGELLGKVSQGLELVMPAIQGKDTAVALRLAKVEEKLNRRYRKLRHGYTRGLKRRGKPRQLIAALFVAHNIEKMGDALLSISEAVISSALGQTMSVERFNSLQVSVASLENASRVKDLQVKNIAETRSGSAISAISSSSPKQSGYMAIYKDGEKRKLKEERQGVESWHEIYPGLAPRIIDYHKRGKSAALLIEHLPGLTFEQMLLRESDALLQEALKSLGKTLRSVWRETLERKAVKANFMAQAGKRMEQVYGIHPGFSHGDTAICGLAQTGFDRLLARAAAYELRIQAPFSVYIHGDFNVDNIIYDAEGRQIRFIDLHRSCHSDYVQDVSVFMVSNYRLQIFDVPLRRRIMQLAKDFYRIAAAFARRQGDDSFEIRLALGLSRSFATSTRFILDESLASGMFLRARYLLEQVLEVDPKRPGNYRIPLKEIFIG
jgi:aminoglycoside phosphotransferase